MNRRGFLANMIAAAVALGVAPAVRAEASGVPFSQEAHEQILADRYADGYLQATQRAESRVALGLPITRGAPFRAVQPGEPHLAENVEQIVESLNGTRPSGEVRFADLVDRSFEREISGTYLASESFGMPIDKGRWMTVPIEDRT